MTRRPGRLAAPLALALLPWVAAPANAQVSPLIAAIPAVPAPTCVGCGGQGSHSSSCPYMRGSGGGDSDSGGGGDITHAPILVAPVGMVGGVFMGGGWFWKEMAGDYPNQGFLSSYGDFMTNNSGDPLFDKPFNFGAKIGGAPWLVLFVPAYPVRQGLVGAASLFKSDPRKPKPAPVAPAPAPQSEVHRAIATRYGELESDTARALERAKQKVAAAEARRLAYLDEIIAGKSEWAALRRTDPAAARAAAEAWLARLVKQREANLKILDDIRARLNGHAELIQKADKTAKDSVTGFLTDATLDILQPKWLEPEFPKLTKWGERGKLGYDVKDSLKSLHESRQRALTDGKTAWEWFSEPETRESSLRLALKFTTYAAPKPVATGAGAAETTIDIVYAESARLLLGAQIEKDIRLREKIAAAGVFNDTLADDYAALVRQRDLALAEETRLQRTRDNYRANRLLHEKKAHASGK